MMTYQSNSLKVIVVFTLFSLFSINPASADNFKYLINAEIDVEKKTVKGAESVTFINRSSQTLDHLYFHIYPNRRYTEKEKDFMLRYGGYFKVNPYPDGFQNTDFKVISEETDLETTIEGEDQTLLKVKLRNAVKPGESVTVTLNFSMKIPHAYGRLGWHENIIALSRWYPILSVHDDEGWKNYPFYPFHRPFYSQAAVYDVWLTVPEDQVVIHSGKAVEESSPRKGYKKIFITTKLPVREFSLSMSPDYQKIEEDWHNITLKSFYLPGDQIRAQKALDNVKSLMEYYAKRFGNYEYKEFSIAPVYLGYGGEQMSNMIYIDTRVFKLPGFLDRYFDFLIAHEAGHQWFYNMVGIDEYKEIWLEEGVHSYFIGQYLEDKYGPDAKIIAYPYWLKNWEWLAPELTFKRTRDIRYKIIARTGWDHPIVDKLSSFQEPSSIFSLTYGKGSRVVEMLKEEMGEDAFNNAFEQIFAEYSFKNLSIDDFIKICQMKSGKDLSAFFDQWLKTDKKLDYAVRKGTSANSVIIENKGGINMPAEVEIVSIHGEKLPHSWDGMSKSLRKSEEIEIKDHIKEVNIDPQGKLLDIDPVNNHWPRRFNVKPVPVYWPLYDHPLFLPEDSYNIVVGPEFANGGIGVKSSFQKPYEYNVYAATDYEFGESILHSRSGFQFNNLFNSQTAWGAEIANRTDYDEGDEDLVRGKIFLRKELWPAAYGLTDINDHVSLYLVRNQGLNKTLLTGGAEENSNISYLKRNESIVGVNLHLNRRAPSFDPKQGYKFDTFFENSGHFFNATQQFTRGGFDASFYQPLCPKATLAYRMKYGGGFPDERNLFELGGINGLRGFDRKEVRGSSALLGSVEVRFPIKENLNQHYLDNMIGIDSVGAVIFVDAGQSWYSSLPASDLKKDAGVGLRATVNVGSFLEKVVVRLDIAQPINDDEDDPHFWFGIDQAF